MNNKRSLNGINLIYGFYKYLWFFIIFPKPIQLILLVIISVIMIYDSKGKLRLNKWANYLLILACIHFTAIMCDILRFPDDVNRLFAAINTATLWLTSGIIIGYVIHCKAKLDIIRIGRYCVINIYINAVMALLAAFLYYVMDIPSVVFLGKNLYGTNWLNSRAVIKYSGFNDYPNMNLFFLMLLFTMSIPYLKRKGRIFTFWVVSICCLSELIIHSRSGLVLFFLSIVIFLSENMSNKYRKAVIGLLCIVTLLLFVLYYKNIWGIIVSKIIYGNTSSTMYRIDLIITTIKVTIKENPIFGIGVKRVFRPEEAYVAYLGSHSTYVGFFYKTGMIGFLIGLLIFYHFNRPILRYYRSSIFVKQIIGFILAFIILFGIEDIDGTNWSIIAYFLSMVLLSEYIGESQKLGVYKFRKD